MTRLDAMLQPEEAVTWRNRSRLGIVMSLLVTLVCAVSLAVLIALLDGGWGWLREKPLQLIPLAALVLLGVWPRPDAVLVTDRRLLLTRGPLRRTVAAIARADILSARIAASVPYFVQVVVIDCRDAAAIRIHRPDIAGSSGFGHAQIGTILAEGADALCNALNGTTLPQSKDDAADNGRTGGLA